MADDVGDKMDYQIWVEIYKAKAISDNLQKQLASAIYSEQVAKYAKRVEDWGKILDLQGEYQRNKHIWPTT